MELDDGLLAAVHAPHVELGQEDLARLALEVHHVLVLEPADAQAHHVRRAEVHAATRDTDDHAVVLHVLLRRVVAHLRLLRHPVHVLQLRAAPQLQLLLLDCAPADRSQPRKYEDGLAPISMSNFASRSWSGSDSLSRSGSGSI